MPITKTKTAGGTISRFVNGVSFFDNRDAFSYVNSSGTEVNSGDGIWARNALPVEGVIFDAPLAHQSGNNDHCHVQPIALRYQLGDHVNDNSTTNHYTESTAAVTRHSPILAWAADGFPIYGPYGDSDPTNASISVRRMVSGFTLRNGSNGTTNLTTSRRTTLPAWAAAVQNRSATLAANQYGQAVSAAFAPGRYLEDHDYLGDLGFTQTTGAIVRDFDLGKFNGRLCVTPEFPPPRFCYFTTINLDGTPAFPPHHRAYVFRKSNRRRHTSCDNERGHSAHPAIHRWGEQTGLGNLFDGEQRHGHPHVECCRRRHLLGGCVVQPVDLDPQGHRARFNRNLQVIGLFDTGCLWNVHHAEQQHRPFQSRVQHGRAHAYIRQW